MAVLHVKSLVGVATATAPAILKQRVGTAIAVSATKVGSTKVRAIVRGATHSFTTIVLYSVTNFRTHGDDFQVLIDRIVVPMWFGIQMCTMRASMT